MAKGKHAAALFEVIHAGKQRASKADRAGLLRTPKWWFKGRQKAGDSAPPLAVDPNDPTMRAAPVATAAPAASIASVPAPVAAPPPRSPAVDVRLDPDRHQITFRVSYTSAIVTAFSVLMVVALAYMVGRNMSRGPAPAIAGPSTEQLLRGPAQPGVLDVGSGQNQPVTPPLERTDRTNVPVVNVPPALKQQQPPAAPFSGRRVNGLNYVIMQSYPDEASAKAAVDILQQHNVGATIEKGLRGYPSNWFIAVGTEGFQRISGQEYQSYIKRIQQISDQFANRRSFKAFQPQGYRWDRS